MAVNQNAGNAFPNRAPTKTAIANINSGYQTYANAYEAVFVTYNGTAVSDATFDATKGDVPVLLFGQDYPLIVQPQSDYEDIVITTADASTTITIPLLQFQEEAQQQSALTAASIYNPELFTPTLTTYNRGQRVQGVTATNSVNVAGWCVDVSIENQALVGSGGALTPSLSLTAIFAGGVIDGPGISYLGDGTGQTSSEPCILLETAYTLAMFNNNNIFADAAGKNWEVVGLYIAPV